MTPPSKNSANQQNIYSSQSSVKKNYSRYYEKRNKHINYT